MHKRLARTIAVAFACVVLAAPALAIDSGGGDTSNSANTAGPTLSDARHFIDAHKYKNAIGVLKAVIARDPNNADALNLMGFSLRRSGDAAHALGFYKKALSIAPNHRGANEYLGELFVEQGQIAKAEAQLKILKSICGTSCEEYKDLAKAIASR